MSDPFLGDELHKLVFFDNVSQPPPPPPLVIQSAFKPYNSVEEDSRRVHNKKKKDTITHRRREKLGSMNKRVLEFMKKDWSKRRAQMRQQQQLESSIRKTHVMNERMRREKQRQCFKELHSILPIGTRNEKISIVQTAAAEIQDLLRRGDELERRNKELEAKLLSSMTTDNYNEATTLPRQIIRVKVDNPTSAGVHSMIELLQRVKRQGLSTSSISSSFGSHEFFAEVEVDVPPI